MNHLFFIAASYGASLLALGLLALWMVLDYRNQRRALSELEARGLGRRGRGTRPGDTP